MKLGSRTFCWRLFLGIIPEEKNFVKWVDCIKVERQKFYTKQEELKITKNKNLDPKIFNPLATTTQNNPWTDLFKDKEMRELITQDIDRTNQEYDFFQLKQVKDILIGILFMWAKENAEISYKQGMNEILAMVVMAFFAERIQTQTEFGKMSSESIAESTEDLVDFIFDYRHTFADIYSSFDNILQFGIKNLY